MMKEKRAAYVRVGWLATGGWIAFCGMYVTVTCGWTSFFAMPANEFGDFLAGAFAPLAFFWLALGLLVQGKQLELQRSELALQREELALQRAETARLADEAARQAKAIEANEAHVRRDVFLKTADIVVSNLNVICSRISDTQYQYSPHYDGEWLQFSQGRKNIFFDRILTMRQWPGTAAEPKLTFSVVAEKYPGLEPVHEFCRQAEYMFNEAELCAADLRQAYENSSLGLVYLYFCEAIERSPSVKFIAVDSLKKLRTRW